MSFKTILSISGVDHPGSDLIAAAELSERVGAHLAAVVIACVPPPPMGDLVGQPYSTWSFEWQDASKRLEDRTSEFRELLAGKGLRGDVQPIYCMQSDVDEEIGKRALYADVSIVGADLLKDDFFLNRVLNGALFQSPAPVILGSKGTTVNLSPKKVLIAWNSGAEAGKALRDAMEMLVGADDVRIAIVDPQATTDAMGQEPGADVAAFLARHGVAVSVDVLASGGRETGAVLRQHAVDLNADLIVMGAYGHSRMRERIFGGVTKSMIDNAVVPVLLAH